MGTKLNMLSTVDIARKLVEEDENLSSICESINNVINSVDKNNFNRLISIKGVKMNQSLNETDESLLKFLYSCFGWKLVVQSRYNENDIHYINVIVSTLKS